MGKTLATLRIGDEDYYVRIVVKETEGERKESHHKFYLREIRATKNLLPNHGAHSNAHGIAGSLPKEILAQAAEKVKALRNLAKQVLPNAPVEVHAALDDAIEAASLPDALAEKARVGRLKRGFHYNGKSHLIAENIHTDKDAVEAILHEGVGHGGLRALFADAEEFKKHPHACGEDSFLWPRPKP